MVTHCHTSPSYVSRYPLFFRTSRSLFRLWSRIVTRHRRVCHGILCFLGRAVHYLGCGHALSHVTVVCVTVSFVFFFRMSRSLFRLWSRIVTRHRRVCHGILCFLGRAVHYLGCGHALSHVTVVCVTVSFVFFFRMSRSLFRLWSRIVTRHRRVCHGILCFLGRAVHYLGCGHALSHVTVVCVTLSFVFFFRMSRSLFRLWSRIVTRHCRVCHGILCFLGRAVHYLGCGHALSHVTVVCVTVSFVFLGRAVHYLGCGHALSHVTVVCVTLSFVFFFRMSRSL